MRKRTILAIAAAAILISATAGAIWFSKEFRVAVLSPAELASKAPTPPSAPDDSCDQAQRMFAEAATKIFQKLDSLGADELDIYNTILEHWKLKPPALLNLSNKTVPLEGRFSDCECLKGIERQSLAAATHSFHLLRRDVLKAKRTKLVDAESQSAIIRTNDPQSSIRDGTPVDAAVDRAFANGLFELSEIAFDAEHHRAIVSYSFVCGGLCGNGGVWLFEKIDGKWKKSEHDCGGWVS